MSAAAPTRITDLLEDAIHELLEAQHEVDRLQVAVEAGSLHWHQIRAIGDRIDNALGKLGD